MSLTNDEIIVFKYLLKYPIRPIYTTSFHTRTISVDIGIDIKVIDSIMPSIGFIMNVDNNDLITNDMYSDGIITVFKIYDFEYLRGIAILGNIEFMYFGMKIYYDNGHEYTTLSNNILLGK